MWTESHLTIVLTLCQHRLYLLSIKYGFLFKPHKENTNAISPYYSTIEKESWMYINTLSSPTLQHQKPIFPPTLAFLASTTGPDPLYTRIYTANPLDASMCQVAQDED